MKVVSDCIANVKEMIMTNTKEKMTMVEMVNTVIDGMEEMEGGNVNEMAGDFTEWIAKEMKENAIRTDENRKEIGIIDMKKKSSGTIN